MTSEHDDRPMTEQEAAEHRVGRATRLVVEMRRGGWVHGQRVYLSEGFDAGSAMPVEVQRVGIAHTVALLGTRLARSAYPPEPGEYDVFGGHPFDFAATTMIGPDAVRSADGATILHDGYVYHRAETPQADRPPAYLLPGYPDIG